MKSPFKILKAVEAVNREQRTLFVDKLREVVPKLKGSRIAVLGLSFKPKTDDMREAPAVTIIQKLQQAGARVVVFDPVAEENARAVLKGVRYCADPYTTAKGADALLIVTEWNEFRDIDLDRLKKTMRRPIIIDGRNIYDPDEMLDKGFIYRGIGRGLSPKRG